MPDNTKPLARIPIIPDSFAEKDRHKNHELVMDFGNNDLYVKNNDGYVNITGMIKDSLQNVKFGSSVIHVVTEDSLPPIKDRQQNHWYWIINSATKVDDGSQIIKDNYIYFGLVNGTYDRLKNYLLISQNVLASNTENIPFNIPNETYLPIFYVPVTLTPTFKRASNNSILQYTIVDRLYALNVGNGTYISYDVYILKIPNNSPGVLNINVTVDGSSTFAIEFLSADDTVPGLQLPGIMHIADGHLLGTLPRPTWTDGRYVFKGWSLKKGTLDPVDSGYVPTKNTQLFAWFIFDSSRTRLAYHVMALSSTGSGISP